MPGFFHAMERYERGRAPHNRAARRIACLRLPERIQPSLYHPHRIPVERARLGVVELYASRRKVKENLASAPYFASCPKGGGGVASF